MTGLRQDRIVMKEEVIRAGRLRGLALSGFSECLSGRCAITCIDYSLHWTPKFGQQWITENMLPRLAS